MMPQFRFSVWIVSIATLALWSSHTSASDVWKTTDEGYPLIAGVWQECKANAKHGPVFVNIVQHGKMFRANCKYDFYPNAGSAPVTVEWHMTGTVNRDGKFTGDLVHTKAPDGWGLRQTRTAILGREGNRIYLHASLWQGGEQDLTWVRVASSESAKTDKQGITVIVNNANVAQSQSVSESASKSASSVVPSNPPAEKKVFIVEYNTGAKGKIRNSDEVTASSPEEAKDIIRQRIKGKIKFQSVTPKE
jgi:hypothetical protein